MQASVLIVDDEEIIRTTLEEFLRGEGFSARSAASAEEALRLVGGQDFELAICDVQLPGMDGIDLLGRMLKINPQMLVLMITAYATVEDAVEAFKAGAHDYLMKPIIFDDVLNKIRRLLEYRQLAEENAALRRQLSQEYNFDTIIGSSRAMQKVFEEVRKVAPTKTTVLLEGESGTGKELIARAIHALSPQKGLKFMPVNCAAIPADLIESQLFGHRKGAFTGADRDRPGLFVSVGEGTIFLDEISDMSIGTQAKFLRAIEQKEILPIGASEPVMVNPRILAATNQRLAEQVEAGRFREDLYYRLNVVTIRVPPLREREEDIPDLVDFFVAKHSRRIGKRIRSVTADTMRLLMSARWKGNVRELDNAIERALIMCEGETITRSDLPPHLIPAERLPELGDDLRAALRSYEKLHLQRVLAQYPDKRAAARRLGLGLSSLYRKIEELGIELAEAKAER